MLYAGFAIFAGSVAMVSGEAPHRLWGTFAAVAYAGAALAGAWRPARVRQVPLAIALGGAVLAPLGWLAASGTAMPEVGVVERSAAMLLRHGQLYESSAALAAGHQLYGYDPYLPLMMAFGLPHALAGPGLWTDPRLWDGLVFAVLAAAALWVAGATHPGRRTALLVASPLIAFPLAVSGNDLPVIGLILLGLAFAGTPDRVQAASRMTAAAGLALGAAAALKAIAWPTLVIIGVLVATRDGARSAGRFAVAALAVLAVTTTPVLVTEPVALIQNTIMFPLGLTATVSTAASPLPGHLLAASGAAGHATAVALLVTAACVLTAVLARRPPGQLPAAAAFLALALAVMFLLAPASRWGYFVYPLGIWAWLGLARRDASAAAGPLPASPGGPPSRPRSVSPSRPRRLPGPPGGPPGLPSDGPPHPGGPERSEGGDADDDSFLSGAGDHDDGVGVGGRVLLAVRHVRRHPDVIAGPGLQPGDLAATRVTEHEHRVPGYHVDARLRRAVMVVAGGRAGPHDGAAHPQPARPNQVAGDRGGPLHPGRLRRAAGKLIGADHAQLAHWPSPARFRSLTRRPAPG